MTASQRKMVLIVGGDPSAAAPERQHLERAGYATLTVATPPEALAMLRHKGVDLILLDNRLPGAIDGLAFHGQMKEAGYDLPVVLLTGPDNWATVIQALRLGVRDSIPRSLEYLDALPEAVGRVLQQVQTEQRLADSEARLASIINSAKDAILVVGAGHRIRLFNAAAEQMFRCPADAALGQLVSRFLPTDYDVPPQAAAAGADDPPQSLSLRARTWTRGVRADGEEFPLEASVSRTEVAGQRFHTIIVRDMTQFKRLEEQFRQAQKMEAVGQLAGGVAHDFNNLLTIMTGYCDLLLGNATLGDQAREQLLEIRKAGDRAAALTSKLLAFSRKQMLTVQLLDLNALVSETERMLRRLIGEHIELSTVQAAGLGLVKADPGQIEQVILNLVLNARDAMADGGRLTLETANVELDLSYRKTHANVPPGRYVLLAVTDTGCGMDAATKAHLFEPFFTTKKVGKGTGLGLATVYGIVQQSRGHIEVHTQPEQGTTFKVYLPRVEEPLAAVRPAPDSLRVPGGSETVLLAEDEEAVRLVVRLALLTKGYTVLEAANGSEAVVLFQRHAGRIDLLITDVVMPKMAGRQLAETLTSQRPGLKVLYLSGYTDDAVVRHGVLETGMPFLQKPFTPTALARKVREVLEQ
jgi:PAS domain S-box-containing protein